MSNSESSTTPTTPQSFSEDVFRDPQDEAFALLHPSNNLACNAFNAVVNHVIEHPTKSAHVRQFLYCDRRRTRSPSVFTENETDHVQCASESGSICWTGAYKLGLHLLPSSEGWRVGTGHELGGGPVDLLLALPTSSWKETRVAGRHALIYL